MMWDRDTLTIGRDFRMNLLSMKKEKLHWSIPSSSPHPPRLASLYTSLNRFNYLSGRCCSEWFSEPLNFWGLLTLDMYMITLPPINYLFLSLIPISQLFWYSYYSGYVFHWSVWGTESFLSPDTNLEKWEEWWIKEHRVVFRLATEDKCKLQSNSGQGSGSNPVT